MKVSFVNLGCKVNRVETDGLAARCVDEGFELSPSGDADFVVINTCTVTQEAEKKTRKAVRRALREHGRATVVVTGCAAVIDGASLESLGNRVMAVPDKSLVVDSIVEKAHNEAKVQGRGGQAGDGTGLLARPQLRHGSGFPTRVGIKVQDGCDNACTFCIVHVARGASWSRPFDEVVDEVRRYGEAGVREMVLTGINLGTYSSAQGGLADLLEKLLEAAPQARFRISSVEPGNVDNRLIGLMASSEGRVCRHLHLPLQSGSDSVLNQMARTYSVGFYQRLVERLYENMPCLALTTDVIVGFPGETEKQFGETLALAKSCAFSKMHVFPYSRREGTPAARRKDHVPDETKLRRTRELQGLADELRRQDFLKRCGNEELVLVETDSTGTSESYYQVTVSDKAVPGELLSMKLENGICRELG